MLYSVFTSVRRPPSDGVTFDSTYNQKNMAYFATNSASPSSGVQLTDHPQFFCAYHPAELFARDNIVPWKNMPK